MVLSVVQWYLACMQCDRTSPAKRSRYAPFISNDFHSSLPYQPAVLQPQLALRVAYSANCITHATPLKVYTFDRVRTPRFTRSSASHSLSVPRHNLSFGSRAFRTSAPKIWNSLPPDILQSQTLSSFRRHLRTHYFQSAYSAPYSAQSQCAVILFWDFGAI